METSLTGRIRGNHSFVVWTGALLLTALSVFPLFTRLGRLPIRLYDESRLAINSYEMVKSGNYLVTLFEGKPDMWNTKPPLMIWLQAGCISMFGNGELAVRLPAAIAGLLTILLVYFFLAIHLRAPLWGIFAGVILASSHGYINLHSTRTGDYDGLLTLFTTGQLLSWFAYLRSGLTRWRYFGYTCLFTVLAVLTKGVGGLLFIPAMGLFLVGRGRLRTFLLSRTAWIGMLLTIALSLCYYFARESVNPGYMKVVFQNEWSGRYLEVNEGHKAPWYFYLFNYREFQFSYYYLLFFVSLAMSFFMNKGPVRKLVQYTSICTIVFLAVISISQTKLEWYDVPTYPLLAISCGAVFYMLAQKLSDAFRAGSLVPSRTALVIFAFYAYRPCVINLNKNFYPSEYEWTWPTYQMSHYFRNMLQGKEPDSGYGYAYEGYHAHIEYYVDLLSDKGIHIPFLDYHALKSGDRVITDSDDIKRYIESHYVYDRKRVFNYIVAFYEIR